MSVGEKIKKLRKEKRWSQDELGLKVGVHGRHISRYENGKNIPCTEVVVKMAQAFNVSTDYLLMDSSMRQPLNKPHDDIIGRIQNLGEISDADKSAIIQFIEALSAKYKFKSMASELR